MTLDATIIVVRGITIVAPIFFISTIVASTRSLLNAPKRPIQGLLIPLASSFFIYVFLTYLPSLVEDVLNRGGVPFPDVHKRNAERIPNRFPVADLHCDTLLWGARDFSKTTYHPTMKDRPIGALDVPRMVQGFVKLQVFAAVNSVPRDMSFDVNVQPSNALTDALVLKTILERWPMKTWFSPKQRVLHQFRRLSKVAEKNSHLLQVIRSKSDLASTGDATLPVKAIMAVEGLNGFGEDINTVDEFFNAGIRILGLVHFFDNAVGGSRSGVSKHGITEFGRHVLRRMKHLGMIVDLAHASDQLITDILDMNPEERPHLMLSHTGTVAICPGQRNLGDELLVRVVQAGGLLGIALFEPALCGDDLVQSFVYSVKHISDITGSIDSIAIGSDWDGNVFTVVSAANTHILAASLIEIGNYSHNAVRRIMYENAFSFFMKSLPG